MFRAGFVSNSSSSSFLLNAHKLTENQVDIIKRHFAYAVRYFPTLIDFGDFVLDERAAWTVHDDGDTLTLSTDLDNFDMAVFLDKIGVVPEAILEGDLHRDMWVN